MNELITLNEQKLEALKVKMDSVERYSEKWFKLKEKYQKIFLKVEKERGEFNLRRILS